MPPKSSKSPYPFRLSPIYTIYFLYLEPLFALGGTYLSIFQPIRFLEGCIPLPGLPSDYQAITPLTTLLLMNIGSLYALFAINEGVVLRLTKEKNVWLTVMGTMCVTDVFHLYAVWAIAPSHFMDFMAWNSDEWINYGTLSFGFALRLAFMLGIRRK
ncbi:hypothetical protein BJ875DRAFT_540660 [Amylocarpus encephaloides]|uniref:DUF7704 domain-containing protein n=1 Tax=Amylocarpus encephaloides TaxID=45428 RepID=A0A9P7YP86_9HELO|nr:hypothetical protein BJ875DRAFT_540660 [Amylocarpus encephaloides]